MYMHTSFCKTSSSYLLGWKKSFVWGSGWAPPPSPLAAGCLGTQAEPDPSCSRDPARNWGHGECTRLSQGSMNILRVKIALVVEHGRHTCLPSWEGAEGASQVLRRRIG